MFPTTTVILVRTYSEGGSTPVKRKSISTYIQEKKTQNKLYSETKVQDKHTDPHSVGREKENNSKKNDEENKQKQVTRELEEEVYLKLEKKVYIARVPSPTENRTMNKQV